MDSPNEEKTLKIFTLNCWGLRYVSKHRPQRIQWIAQHLNEHEYDIVFLQEIWCESDFEYLTTTTKAKFKFSHKFANGSALGTSGLVVMTAWMPRVFHFDAFHANGSPFRPWHGDWFTAKGVGYVRLHLDSLAVHAFCTHMHAQYTEDERLGDQYSIHRICQSYQLAKFVNLMASSNTSLDSHLIILAGDLNSSAKQLPYRLLVSMTGLNDCYNWRPKASHHKLPFGAFSDAKQDKRLFALSHESDNVSDSYETDDELITCGHYSNSFTRHPINAKRIDFIMYNFVDKFKENSDHKSISSSGENIQCKVDYVKCLSKNPDSRISFSDHQPVVVKLNIRCFAANNDLDVITAKCNGNVDCEQSNIADTDDINMEGDGISVISGNKKSNAVHNAFKFVGEGNGNLTKSHDNDGDGKTKHELTFNDYDSVEQTGLLSGKRKLKSNILLDIAESGSKACKSGPLQLKHVVHNVNDVKTSLSAKLDSKSLDKRSLLECTKNLLLNYISESDVKIKQFLRISAFILFLSYAFIFALFIFKKIAAINLLFLFLIITMTALALFFFKMLAFRYEQNAVKAVINDINIDIFLSNNS